MEADRHEVVAGAAALAAGGEIHIKAGTTLVLEGGDVTLRGPGGFVRIDGGGVTIDGAAVKIKQGGAPGAGPGAHPALPVVPLRSDQGPGPRRLPLLSFPPGLLPPNPFGRGRNGDPPSTPEELTICGFICACNANSAPHTRPADCLTARIRAFDAASGNTSRLKAEVPYDMTKNPPAPVMSRKEPERPSGRKHPKGSRAPDVVIVKDPSKPPTQDNIEKVIEVKFPTDRFRGDQKDDYKTIAGPAGLKTLTPASCGCFDGEPQPQRREVTAKDAAEAALLVLLVIALILDDALPGGQIDDGGIPPALARILERLAPLLRGPIPVIP
ncbi:MAG: VRR-NUC domain-containing protein [Polyangiaceae bacterium]|nr:VRR-NUC domain-containing protein [Polyangiaceae bacterium]